MNKEYTLSPNPAQNGFNILGSNKDFEKIQIIDHLGQFVDFKFNVVSNTQIEINTEKFVNGIYYVFISSRTKQNVLQLSIFK